MQYSRSGIVNNVNVLAVEQFVKSYAAPAKKINEAIYSGQKMARNTKGVTNES